MLRALTVVACSLLALSGVATAAENEFVPFPVDWTAEAASPADLSFLLDAPAGKDGPVRIANGHFVKGDGKRLRLWGVNATQSAGLPAKASAPLLAKRLAQCGVNAVRFHFLDAFAPKGLIDAKRDDTRTLDPAQLDLLDFFIAELKKRGIYANLNLNVAHAYKPGDGVKDCDLLGYAKALTYFDPRLLELQREYARALLTHRNPYTQSEYRNEPAVAIVELVNENSLVESWMHGRLLGRNTTKNPGTWTDIPASYEKDLTTLYNAWLRGKLKENELTELRTEAKAPAGELIPRLQPNEFAKASKLRFQTEAAFYIETERTYFQEMKKFLRDELGVKAPLVGSADHSHGRSGYPHVSSTSVLDVVDGHVYWQHPNYVMIDGKRSGFTIWNTPMADEPATCSIVQLARTPLAGMPYTVSEANHPFPAEAACEGIPILAAYAAFQDWDGIFWYTLGHKDAVAESVMPVGHFDLFPDPVKMTQLRAGALMFLRGDIRPAKETVTRSMTREQVLESIRLPKSDWPLFSPGFNPLTALAHGVRLGSFDGPALMPAQVIADDPIRSDTGELAWQFKNKAASEVVVDTPRSQALIGHCKAAGRSSANLMAQIDTPFCALTLQSLDQREISRAATLLLTACARVENTGQQWDEKRKTLQRWGKAPACIEPVRGAVILRGLEGATAVSAQPLDGAGRALGGEIPAQKTDAGWSLPLGQPPTTWYVLKVAR
ncbi:MAG TPA: hypothetical protein VGP72_03430 [Planctomycetota bacterium]|jgi:hypothetical protein